MAMFEVKCPRCGRTTALDIAGECTNLLNSGAVCGFRLPFLYGDGNGKYRDKFTKHTNPPPSGMVNSNYSWVSDSGAYPVYQSGVMDHGSVHLDPVSNYLFLWHTPSGDNPSATVMYGSAGTVNTASGVIMPINSKPQNLHHFYDNYQPHFVPVCDGSGLLIKSPDHNHSTFQIMKEGNLAYEYDPLSQSGVSYL